MDQSKVKMSIFLRGSNLIPKDKKRSSKNGEKQRGMMDLGGGQVNIG